jgi:hypothetical protein
MLYQIVCLSCGYHQVWASLLDAHVDGLRHHAEDGRPSASPPAPNDPEPQTPSHNRHNRPLPPLPT